jgi:hypothetical protein
VVRLPGPSLYPTQDSSQAPLFEVRGVCLESAFELFLHALSLFNFLFYKENRERIWVSVEETPVA